MIKFLNLARGRQDLVFALFMILIVCMLVMPLPVFMVDALLALNLAITLLLLVASTYLKSVLEITTFPSILLISTVYRLALSVATTRLILTEGNAGHVIEAFGLFLVGGNIVVGLVIFFIIAIVNFIVITKGTERIAEVSARFTLDAMPGKQMSIDSDLRNGDIDKDQAKKRRNNLEQESQFHGAMDGAMRFVKGDAIASLIIIFVNLIGGITIGVMQKGMTFAAAGHHYTIMSIGDGLVAQVPAMFTSVAAGAIVTRVADENSKHLGQDITNQLGAEPKSMAVACFAIVMLGFLPGFPTVTFLTLGAIMGGIAFLSWRGNLRRQYEEMMMAQGGGQPDMDEPQGDGPTPEDMGEAPSNVTPPRPADKGDAFIIRAQMHTIIAMAQSGIGNALEDRMREVVNTVGFPVPIPGFRPDGKLPEGIWEIDVEDVASGYGFWRQGFAVPLTEREKLQDIGLEFEETMGPDGQNALWVDQEARNILQENEIAFRAPNPIMAERVINVVKFYAARTFGVNEANQWLEELGPRLGKLITDAQANIPILKLVDVMRKLLEEEVPIGQPRLILEELLNNYPREEDADKLADIVRMALARQICFAITGNRRVLNIVTIGPDIEEILAPHDYGYMEEVAAPALAPHEIVTLCQQAYDAALAQADGSRVVFVIKPEARRILRKLLVEGGLRASVLATNEVHGDFQARPLGVVSQYGNGNVLEAGNDEPMEFEDEGENARVAAG